jgi:hypothetical protein
MVFGFMVHTSGCVGEMESFVSRDDAHLSAFLFDTERRATSTFTVIAVAMVVPTVPANLAN